MEYAQERITTLHDFGRAVPNAPVDRAAVVVPMTEREYATLAAERMLTRLSTVSPGQVVVALRSSPDRIGAFRDWLANFDLPLQLVWCNGPTVSEYLNDHGLDGSAGKGRDVWLALGVGAETHPYVVCHDADNRTYDQSDIARLLAPLNQGYSFSKAFYARIEDGRLYGRLFRLLYVPLVRALNDDHFAPILTYLAAFRYALAGEFGITADLAKQLHVERRFGLEVGTLGDAFDQVGFAGTAQVDLGRYEHDHRAVSGPTGLVDMSTDVAAALFRVIEAHGIEPRYDSLQTTYQTVAETLIDQYQADANHNDLEYDSDEERSQVKAYRKAIQPPDTDDRLPAWSTAPINPNEILEATRTDLKTVS